MGINDLVPWNWSKKRVPIRREGRGMLPDNFQDHFDNIHRQWNTLVEDLFAGFMPGTLSRFHSEVNSFSPRIDVNESAHELTVIAELPGMSQENVDISLNSDSVVIKGEKLSETNEQEGERSYIERSFGSFERIIPLTSRIDEDRVDAHFKNGVLTIKLPKVESEIKSAKKISVRTEP